MIVVKEKTGDKTLPLGNFAREQLICEELIVGANVEIKGINYEIVKVNNQVPSMLIIDVKKVA